MGPPRFFVGKEPDAADGDGPATFRLDPADLHHAAHVLRLSAGDEVEIVAPDGRVMTVELTSAPHDALTGRVVRVEEPLAGMRTRVALFQGLAKGDKLDLVVEKAVEIGVDAIVPVIFERSVIRLTPERARQRGDRLRRVAVAAAKQSKRTAVPDVSDPVEASALPALLAGYDIVLVAWEDAPRAPGIGAALSHTGSTMPSSVAIVVGPEGGFTPAEVDALVRHGARQVSLGATVLRTETAGIVAAALVIYECGGLGGVRHE